MIYNTIHDQPLFFFLGLALVNGFSLNRWCGSIILIDLFGGFK